MNCSPSVTESTLQLAGLYVLFWNNSFVVPDYRSKTSLVDVWKKHSNICLSRLNQT